MPHRRRARRRRGRGRPRDPGAVGLPRARPPGRSFFASRGTRKKEKKRYWGDAAATAAAFDADGWFATGDVAARDAAGSYKILGRASVDIIKSGGYKISALDVERVLLAHPRVREAAVVGVPDAVYGQRVGAVLVVDGSDPLGLEALRTWCDGRLATYRAPTRLAVASAIAKNAVGKVNKVALLAAHFPDDS